MKKDIHIAKVLPVFLYCPVYMEVVGYLAKIFTASSYSTGHFSNNMSVGPFINKWILYRFKEPLFSG
jgi:hypothetical protein